MMRASWTIQWCPLILLLFSTLVVAWPWPRWMPEIHALVVRDEGDSNSTSSSSSSPTASSSASKETETGSTDNDSDKDSDDKSSSKSTATATKSKAFDARLPAGGVSMQTPTLFAGAQYYKIGDQVTFGWNYTSLLATPTAINVMATCTANSQLYTIAMNQTFDEATGSVSWDTGAYQETSKANPLLTETYTLLIYDADSSISATSEAGYLAVYNRHTFGMYTPQPYTPLADYQCATCSGALGKMEKRALKMMLGVCAITVLSFTWFVGGTGVVW